MERQSAAPVGGVGQNGVEEFLSENDGKSTLRLKLQDSEGTVRYYFLLVLSLIVDKFLSRMRMERKVIKY